MHALRALHEIEAHRGHAGHLRFRQRGTAQSPQRFLVVKSFRGVKLSIGFDKPQTSHGNEKNSSVLILQL
jgi:hypothetical protein